jgi:3-hydroxyacyl-[acyl-carrier-protein] dehydratase
VKFHLIDKVEFASPQKLIGVKQVSLAEEYLADHFPTFPVLPGVLMLEALTQAAAWMLHLQSDFARSIAVLKEARNVKYGTFVAPGNALRVEVEAIAYTTGGGTFKAAGTVGSALAVSARIEMAYFNLADRQAELAFLDGRLIEKHRSRWAIIAPGPAPVAVG